MVPVNNFYFLKNVSSAQTSAETKNMTGETLTMQIDGTGVGFSIKLLGCSDMASENYYELTGLTTSFSNIQTMTTNGIYTFGIEGISKLKVQLTSIASGSVTVFGKITKGV